MIVGAMRSAGMDAAMHVNMSTATPAMVHSIVIESGGVLDTNPTFRTLGTASENSNVVGLKPLHTSSFITAPPSRPEHLYEERV